jgi:hypothetical protein
MFRTCQMLHPLNALMMVDPRDTLRRVPLLVVRVVFQQHVFYPYSASPLLNLPATLCYHQTGCILADTEPCRTVRLTLHI